MRGRLVLEDGTVFTGTSFGSPNNTSGEVVFSTGMVGYPESLTDPSYTGQILIFTYPLIGNYGVAQKSHWESNKIHVRGVIVSNYIDTPSHHLSKQTLKSWLKKEQIPALEIPDTRLLTQKIRSKGTMLGKILVNNKKVSFFDPNHENLVAKVSTKQIIISNPKVSSYHTPGVIYVDTNGKPKTVLLYDCGAKDNIARCLVNRGVRVITVPWNFDPFAYAQSKPFEFDAVVISNGPGDPKMAKETIVIIKKFLDKKIPILGVCLGNQLLALAAGGDTAKLKFGHRSQNQPCLLAGSNRCYITTQNHGFDVRKIPKGFKPWFINANDGSNEGIMHEKLPFMSVQFHPEARPGPKDTEWIFDYFLNQI